MHTELVKKIVTAVERKVCVLDWKNDSTYMVVHIKNQIDKETIKQLGSPELHEQNNNCYLVYKGPGAVVKKK